MFFCIFEPTVKQIDCEQQYDRDDPIIPYLMEGLSLECRNRGGGWAPYWGDAKFAFPIDT